MFLKLIITTINAIAQTKRKVEGAHKQLTHVEGGYDLCVFWQQLCEDAAVFGVYVSVVS